ncbi:MAG: AAA family ATPase [Polyangiaceae bacterium]|nr:AAA family ATPase [Polyangiaceae bacterium]
MVIVVMGPSGAGKSTVGALVARHRGATFVDADDFHPVENIAKMQAGVPLDETDRVVWLERLAIAIDGYLAGDREVVLACSALRAAHRRVLRRDPTRVVFVYLRAARATLDGRLRGRRGHFMSASLLDSQLAALEEPDDAIVVDAEPPVDDVVHAVELAVGRR